MVVRSLPAASSRLPSEPSKTGAPPPPAARDVVAGRVVLRRVGATVTRPSGSKEVSTWLLGSRIAAHSEPRNGDSEAFGRDPFTK